MKRYRSALTGMAAALALVVSSAASQAASPHAAPAVMTKDQSAGSQNVGDRGWDGGWRHKRRHDDDFRFSFGIGAPFAYHPQPYAYRTVTCPYGYWYDGYGCVIYRHHPQPYYYGARPGFSVQLGF